MILCQFFFNVKYSTTFFINFFNVYYFTGETETVNFSIVKIICIFNENRQHRVIKAN